MDESLNENQMEATPGVSVNQPGGANAPDSANIPQADTPPPQIPPVIPDPNSVARRPPPPNASRVPAPTQEDFFAAFKASVGIDIAALQQQFQDFLAGKNVPPAQDKGKAVVVDLDTPVSNEKIEATNPEKPSQVPAPPVMEGSGPSNVMNQQQYAYYGWAPQGPYYGYGGYPMYPPLGSQQTVPTGWYNPMQPTVPTAGQTGVVAPADGCLAPHIQAAPMDHNYKMPYKLDHYNGEKDPEDHLRSFKAAMQISNLGDS